MTVADHAHRFQWTEPALTFDDVLLVPAYSEVLPREVDLRTRLSRRLRLNIPLFASAMDTVSEAPLAIAVAREGGMAVIHKNLPVAAQAAQVARVKGREEAVAEALDLLDESTVARLLAVGRAGGGPGGEDGARAGLIERFPRALRDGEGRLVVGAAVGPTAEGDGRIAALVAAGVDAIVIDTAHGHSRNVLRAVRRARECYEELPIIAGNVATSEAVDALAEAGADVVKVGIGPGSICTTRIVAGVGVPQISAILDCAAAARSAGLGIIADGGIKHSGDLVKAIAAGADAVMVGSLLAGTDESPGEVVVRDGMRFKAYRGMGSLGAMQQGSRDRYFQEHLSDADKLVPEGVEAVVPCKGPVRAVLHQLLGGLRSGMGYTGSDSIPSLQRGARFVRMTGAGLAESHVHGVAISRPSPNYRP